MKRQLVLSVSIALLIGNAHAADGDADDTGYSVDRAGIGMLQGGSPVDACVLFRDGFEGVPGRAATGGGAPIEVVTSGGYTIRIDLHQIIATDAIAMNKVEHWGDPHENLNGKHIKDWGGEPEWHGSRRSLILGDGTKITMASLGAQGVVLETSIYDGNQNFQIDNCSNTIMHHGVDQDDTEQREQAQFDGETSIFETDTMLGTAVYTNIYNEDEEFDTVEFDWPLGVTGGYANPNQVTDFYDDPRLGHT